MPKKFGWPGEPDELDPVHTIGTVFLARQHGHVLESRALTMPGAPQSFHSS